MANERITENIIRDRLRELGYYNNDKVIIEEQKSENLKVNKLLTSTSKKGSGYGYPDFIITYNKYPDLLIVIECKADIQRHESKDRDRYSDYAVDGALLYASYLSKDFDVIAIGISSENIKRIKISHYLQLKSTSKSVEFLGNELLSIDNYYESYIQSPIKVNMDYSSLLAYSAELNNTLHSKKIQASKRSILISALLIALQNKLFKDGYKNSENAFELSELIVRSVKNELRSSNVSKGNLNNILYHFGFIKKNPTLSKDRDFVISLIEEIDSKINSFIGTHKFFDVIGQFYIEFLKYANNNKDLGIVLTPPHITEFFVELVDINKDSIVYDNCCGTGGFLISAMKKMTEDAKGNIDKVKLIRDEQIIGVEFQDDIYALVVSNMILHGDGKSNVLYDDCFKKTNFIKTKYKPNVGFLNPPYKKEKEDREELEFILNNLESLEKNGTCIAIVPMQRALAQKGNVYEYKKKLLEKHTLEAVLSMPDELFFNSQVGVVSCIMVFKAHNPHPKNKETYFGYYKDDGFVKRKTKGRYDALEKWEKIKEKWISNYINRKDEVGLSVCKVVTADDEWCAEAYMKTDYSQLTKEDFSNELKKYIMYKELCG